MQCCVTGLLDVHAPRKGNLLSRVPLRPDTGLIVVEITRSDRWMMADLFTHKRRWIALGPARADKDLTKEGIERLLDAIAGIATGILLGLQARQKPFQYGKDPLLRCILSGRRAEEVRVLDPVAREFCGRLVCEHERRGCNVAEVAFNG